MNQNNNFLFETLINSKITDSLLINLTWSPGKKKDFRGPPPPPWKLPPFGPRSPLNFRCPPWGVWIFSVTTYYGIQSHLLAQKYPLPNF